MIETKLPLTEDEILAELAASDARIQEMRVAISSLNTEIQTEVEQAGKLLVLYRNTNQSIKEQAERIIKENPKVKPVDKRTMFNVIKNINIGISLSFRHKRAAGLSPEAALAGVMEYLHKKAVKTTKIIRDGDPLPPEIQAQLDQDYIGYSVETFYLSLPVDLPNETVIRLLTEKATQMATERKALQSDGTLPSGVLDKITSLVNSAQAVAVAG